MSLIQSPLHQNNPYLDHDKASLPERRTLHGESLGSSRVSLIEVVVLIVRHFVVAVEFSETYVSNMEAVSNGAVELRFLDDVQLSIICDHQGHHQGYHYLSGKSDEKKSF